MADIILLRRPRESPSQKTGLGRYSDSVEQFLTNNKIEYEVIELDMSLSKGYVNAIMNGVVRPFFKVLFRCRRRHAIVHATDELCGYLFPFAAGKRIVTVHHVPIFGDNRLWSALTRTSLKHSEKVVAISSLTKNDLEEFSKRKLDIDVISNSIDPIYGRDESITRALSVGVVAQLSPRKNIHVSIDAFDKLTKMPGMKDCTMYICGSGELYDDLRTYVESKGLSQNVRFIEHISDDELVELYNKISLLFNTSLQEGFGMTTLEANMCGTPSLYLKEAKIPKIVLGGSVCCEDAEDMASKAYDLLSDKEKYQHQSELSMRYAWDVGKDFNNKMNELYGIGNAEQ